MQPIRVSCVAALLATFALFVPSLSGTTEETLSRVDGQIVEMVFVGQGRVRVEPPDRIERAQVVSRPRPAVTSRRPSTSSTLLDTAARIQIASLRLDQGKVAEADEMLREARKLGGAGVRQSLDESFDVVRARIDLLRGEPTKVVKRFKKRVQGRRRASSIEAYLLLAIASKETGETELFEKAMERARDHGADLSELRAE